MVEGFEGGGLADIGDAEGDDGLEQAFDDRRVGHGVADSQPGQPVGLGEGAQQHEIRIVADQDHTIGAAGSRGELPVGLVEGDEHMGRHPIEEVPHFVIAQHRAGRVVR
jgi:hypothetical protein